MFERPTNLLKDLVHPFSLEEALENLVLQGDVEWFEIGDYDTAIKISPTADLATLFQEAIQPRPDGRPEAWKKRNFKN